MAKRTSKQEAAQVVAATSTPNASLLAATVEQVQQARPAPIPVSQSLPLFLAFDAEADAEAGRPDPKDWVASRQRLAQLIDALPQRAVILEADKDSWLERTMRTALMRIEMEMEGSAYTPEEQKEVSAIMETLADAETEKTLREQSERRLAELNRMIQERTEGLRDENSDHSKRDLETKVAAVHKHVMWHIRRASGIGGSEASTVRKHFEGKRGTFGDAHNLVLEKLLKLAPRPSTPEMARGVRAEPHVQAMYHAKHAVRSEGRDLRRMRNFRWGRRPASIGTPDDIVIHTIGPHAGLKRCLDYKAPSAAVVKDYLKNGVSEDYVIQLHHYAVLQLASGSKFDVMSIEAFNPDSFEIVSFEVPFDKDLAQEVIAANHRLFHEFILNGIVPDAPKPDDLAVEDEAIIKLAAEAAMLKKLSDAVILRQKELLERISLTGAAWHEQATGKMDLQVASFNRKRKWDEVTLRQLAVAGNVDIAPFLVADKKGELDADQATDYYKDLMQAYAAGPEAFAEVGATIAAMGLPVVTKLNVDGLAEELSNQGIDTLVAAGVSESFLITRKTKGPEYERLMQLEGWVGEMTDAIVEMAEANYQRVILGRDPEQQALDDEVDYDVD